METKLFALVDTESREQRDEEKREKIYSVQLLAFI